MINKYIQPIKDMAIRALGGQISVPAPKTPGEESQNQQASTTEAGFRQTPERMMQYYYQQFWVDMDLVSCIRDIRLMDRKDGRVKRIHNRIARDVTKSGLMLKLPKGSDIIRREWHGFVERLQLSRPEKLKSDARGLIMEGNLPLQWVLNEQMNITGAIRMPAETIRPNVSQNGRFSDVKRAYSQVDLAMGRETADFALWQLFVARLDPDNFDDLGCMGRPMLDASRGIWNKLRMTEEDLVIRRRTRAPLRLSHVLEGATEPDLEAYRRSAEAKLNEITTDFYQSRKGGVSAVQGDSNLDQISDVVLLLDNFFAGTPLPKALLGYTDGLARDILADLKGDYFDEVDGLQDTLSTIYESGFRLQLLLKGIVAGPDELTVSFSERRTETPNQATDRALKLQALGLPKSMVLEELGYDPSYVHERMEDDDGRFDPYPNGDESVKPGKVSITPGNAPNGESATSIRNQ